jgi:hypothetical protein
MAAAAALALAPAELPAQGQAQPAPGALAVTASLRTRAESWDWFDAGEQGEYAFLGSLLRAGLGQERSGFGWRAEVAAPVLLGLPDDAVLPPPQGQLGLGAAYSAANGEENAAGLFLKQAWLRVGAAPGREGHRLRVGRMEFVEGTETAPKDPTVAAVKRDRLAHRVLGNFGWSHAQRSFDGAHYAWTQGATGVTLLAARPTQGVFRVNGWPGLDVGVGYAALTRSFAWGGGSGEWRAFGMHYRDGRDAVATDNRPLPARQADAEDVAVTTLGGHYLHVFRTGAGEVDLLLWGAGQAGDWESQSHRAGAVAAEAGIQPGGLPALRPWIRAGWFRGTGDGDPADGRHGTFFSVLPTPRIYARFPFFNQMNSRDAFASLALRPGQRLTVRTDVHALRLDDGADLWYSGGGAFEEASFGYAGRPSGGERGLATLFDLSADFRVSPRLSINGYVGWARGDEVLERVYPGGGDGRLAYLEAELRY